MSYFSFDPPHPPIQQLDTSKPFLACRLYKNRWWAAFDAWLQFVRV